MANPEHLAILTKGVEVWNRWRKAFPNTRPDLEGANLSGADLSNANLSRTNLVGAKLNNINLFETILFESNLTNADLSRAKLARADFTEANLSGTNFSGAKFNHTCLNKANLTGSDLSEADLLGSNLSGANLSGANLSGAKLNGVDLFRTNLSGANLSNADLAAASLLHTNLQKANLSNCYIYGISVWDVDLSGAIQKDLVITPNVFPKVTVDNIEVAQFIYLLLNNKNIRDVIDTIAKKGVLILGRFSERMDLLESISSKIRGLGYLPIVFDFEKPTDRDFTETIKILAGLSLFVIADITNPRSVPLELQATIPDYQVPFVPIIQSGQSAFSMFDDLPKKYNWVLHLLEYKDKETLLAAFEKQIVRPALEKLNEIRAAKSRPPERRIAGEE